MTRAELAELREKRAAAYHTMRSVLDASDGELSPADAARFDEAEREFDRLDGQITAEERGMTAAREGIHGRLATRDRSTGWEHRSGGHGVATIGGGNGGPLDGPFLARSASLASWVESRGLARQDDLPEPDQRAFRLGAAIRGLVTGNWEGADRERRALSSGASATGGILVPTLVSAQVIDALRDRTTALEAGARIVPMGSETVKLPRIASLPTPGWRAQNAPVVEGEPAFDGLELKAKTLAVLCKVPYELFEDVSAEASQAIEAALVTALALELDRAAYFGTGTGDQPLGLVNTPGVTTTAVGAAPTDYSALVAAYFAVRRRNAVPNAAVYSERTAETYAGLTASDGQPLNMPPALADLAQHSTNAIPDDEGAGTNESSLIVGQFDQLAVGFRPQVGFRVVSSSEPYMDHMQVAVLAYLRADVGVINPAAFDVRDGILAA